MERLLCRLGCLLLILSWTAGDACAAPDPIDKASGAAQARRDLAAGKVKVLVGGGIAVFAPAVPDKDPRFAKIARESVPCGCTSPQAREWFDYAGGYNAVVVDYVRDQKRTP